MSVRLEAELDDAKIELAALQRKVTLAKDTCRAAVEFLAANVATTPGSQTRAIEVIFEELQEFASVSVSEIERRILSLEEQVADEEESDLQRSRPITI